MKCVVDGCENRQRKKRVDGITFHKFPENEEDNEMWREILGVPNISTKKIKICSKHFLESDFIGNMRCRRLKVNAIPIAVAPETNQELHSSEVTENSMEHVNLPIETVFCQSIGESQESSTFAVPGKNNFSCVLKSISANANQKNIDLTLASSNEWVKCPCTEPPQDSSRLEQTKEFVTVATNTGPDLAMYNIQRLEAKVQRLREILKQKDRTVRNLRQQIKRHQDKLPTAKELAEERCKYLVNMIMKKRADTS